LSADDPDFGPLLNLYSDRFPLKERRTEAQLSKLLGEEEPMNFLAVYQDSTLAGFIIWWDFSHFGYIEHFAKLPACHGKDFGHDVLELIRQWSPRTLLEVEIPSDENGQHLIWFYERNDFFIVNKDYFQPPYRKGGTFFPMYLMSDFKNWDTGELQQAVLRMHEQVYFQHH
jgi:GNAT superfamily N-acetyltransferase